MKTTQSRYCKRFGVDKNSAHYFMCHMTQKEFEERTTGFEKKEPIFNKIGRDEKKSRSSAKHS